MEPQQLTTTQIKCYLKLYQSNGLCSPQSHPPINYEILDENTLLRKTNKSIKQNYQLYPFNRVFSSRISNSLMAQNIRFLDDLYQGINHTMIAMVNQQTHLLLETGTIQQYGLLIELYLALSNDQRINYKSNTVFSLSMFATVNQKPNQFIDLLNGQRYTFLSKKDVDTQSYKTFYEVKISTLQQYLISVKIGMIRFKQCCNSNDFLVWRINLSNQDEFSSQRTISTGNIVICQQGNKNLQTFIKQLSNLVQKSTGTSNKVTDHGSLFSCLQNYLRNGKLSFIQCLMNDYDHIESHLQQLKNIPTTFMNKSTQYKINQQPLQLSNFINQLQQQIQKQSFTTKKKITSLLSSLTPKQLQKFKQLHSNFKTFIKQSIDKLNAFINLYKHCQQTREEFYQRQKFPVSIEIKDLDDTQFTMKTFYIAKIYSLSEKFQMQNLQNTSQKMMTIKNQLQIALKTLISILSQNSKKLYNTDSFSLGKSYVFIATPKKKKRQNIDQSINDSEPSIGKYEKVLKQMKNHLEKIRKNLKYILNLNPRYLNEQNKTKQKSQPKFHQINQSTFQLDNLDFSKLLGQQLVNNIEKHLKTISNNKKQLIRQNGSMSIIRNEDNESIEDKNEQQQITQVRQKLTKKTVFFHQRSQKSVTQTSSLQANKNSILDISAIQTAQIQRTKRLLKQHESLQKSLMQIKRSQIQKHLQIRQGISQFQQSKLQQNVSQLKNEEKITKISDKLKTLCLVKKSSKKLLKKIVVQKQNSSLSKYDPNNQSMNKIKIKHLKSQTINTVSTQKQQNQQQFNKNYHSRHQSTPTSLHVQPCIMRKNRSIVRINNLNNQSISFPQISSKSADKILDINLINQHLNKINKSSSPKLKKKHLIKVVKNSFQDQIQQKNQKQTHKNNQNQENKSFLPDISLLCKKILT